MTDRILRGTQLSAIAQAFGSLTYRRSCCIALLGVACRGGQKDTDDLPESTWADTADTADESDTAPDSSDTSVETAEPKCLGSGPWVSVSAGFHGSCGIHEDGCIECWTASDTGGPSQHIDETGYAGPSGDLVPPDGSYSAVDIGRCNLWGTHTCAIRQADQGIECWGSDAWGAASPPPGQWAALSLGEDDSCALGVDGRIACWGRYVGSGDSASWSVSTDYVGLSDCNWTVCGLAADGRVDCWEVGHVGDVHANLGPWIAMTSDWHPVVFGVTPEGEISTSVGVSYLPEPAAPAVNVCVTGVPAWGCVLDVDGQVVCNDGLRDVPDATFSSIACGGEHVCGVTTEGGILCWGECEGGQCDVPMHE